MNRFPANPTSGQPVTFSAVVKNQGTGLTPSGVVLRVAFSIDGATNIFWSEGFSSSLPPDSSVVLRAEDGLAGNTWPAAAGTHSIGAAQHRLGLGAKVFRSRAAFNSRLAITENFAVSSLHSKCALVGVDRKTSNIVSINIDPCFECFISTEFENRAYLGSRLRTFPAEPPVHYIKKS
jgi:hypothetical protein